MKEPIYRIDDDEPLPSPDDFSEPFDIEDEEENWQLGKRRIECHICHGIGCTYCNNLGYTIKK